MFDVHCTSMLYPESYMVLVGYRCLSSFCVSDLSQWIKNNRTLFKKSLQKVMESLPPFTKFFPVYYETFR